MSTLRRMGDSLLGLLHARLQLFSLELQGEKFRLLDTLLRLALAVVLGSVGGLVGIAALGLFLWEVAGYAGLIGLSSVLLLSAAGVLYWSRRRWRESPRPFEATIDEFQKDRACLQKEP